MVESQKEQQQREPESFSNIPEVLARATEAWGDRPAFSSFGYDLGYRELERRSRDFAAWVQQRTTLRPGDRIAIQLPNILQYPIVLFGALRAGLVVVNTNPLYTPHEMLHQFKDAGIRALVVLSNFADKAEEVSRDYPIDYLILTDIGDALPWHKRVPMNFVVRYLKKMVPRHRLAEARSLREVLAEGAGLGLEPVSVGRGDLAMLQYTGGTTGVAKGAMLTHGNLLANLEQVREAVSDLLDAPDQIAIAPLPLYHIYSFTVNCLVMIDRGVQVVLIANPRDIPGFVKTLSRYPFTIFTGLNTLFVALCRNPQFRKLDFSHLRITLSGGMALTRDAARQWQEATGCPINEGYGLTETSPVVSLNPPGRAQLGTIGLPMPRTEVKLIDEDGSEVPVGGTGELCVRGPQVMLGYWNQPEETARVLSSDGWFRTGDVAQIQEDGYLRIVDRKKDMILVSGFNVYPGELEDVIVTHPDIDECAVVGVPDPVTGEKIKAYVVSRNPNLTVQEVRQYCRERLTAYKVPAQVEFRKELPKTNVGKVLRRALRDEQNGTQGAA